MAPTRDLDPSSSVLGFFGSELRRFREASGLTQDRLGEVVNYTGSLVGLVETARRKPSREFTERCDAALGTDGALARIWPLLGRRPSRRGSAASWSWSPPRPPSPPTRPRSCRGCCRPRSTPGP
ncbi:helix-turn-helix domain-containing protein [Kitasatospora arboriphila]